MLVGAGAVVVRTALIGGVDAVAGVGVEVMVVVVVGEGLASMLVVVVVVREKQLLLTGVAYPLHCPWVLYRLFRACIRGLVAQRLSASFVCDCGRSWVRTRPNTFNFLHLLN
jgi:hypothetical protein